jgi:hypothetical protein
MTPIVSRIWASVAGPTLPRAEAIRPVDTRLPGHRQRAGLSEGAVIFLGRRCDDDEGKWPDDVDGAATQGEKSGRPMVANGRSPIRGASCRRTLDGGLHGEILSKSVASQKLYRASTSHQRSPSVCPHTNPIR